MKYALLCAQLIFSLFAPSLFAADWIYAIRPGDTLSGIAHHYLKKPGDWAQLQVLNAVEDPRRLIPGTSLRIPVVWLRQGAAIATAIHVRGEVVRVSSGDETPLQAGDELNAGEVLRTGADSNASLRFFDGSRLLVAANTRITLARMRQYGNTGMAETTIRLHEGNVDSRVNRQQFPAARYRVESQAMNLGVRGTVFRVGVAPGGVAHGEVVAGRVLAEGARGGKAIGLDAGYGTVASVRGGPSAAVALAHPPVLSGLPERIERLPLQFVWPAADGVFRWRAQVFSERSDDVLLLDDIFTGPVASWPELRDGRYRLRVRAVSDDGVEGLDAEHVFVLAAHPEAPLALGPNEGAVVRSSPVTLRWARPLGVSGYRLQVADNAGFDPLLVDQTDLTSNEFQVPVVAGNYYWRVASHADDGRQGPFSLVHRFSQLPPPASPDLAAPELDDDALLLRWPQGTAGQTYRLQISGDADFNTLIVDEQLFEPGFRLARESLSTSVFVRLQAIDPGGVAGPFSRPQQIEVPSSLPSWLLLLVPLMFAL
ncbi:MAG: FecR domain-containing protein [Azoarcus sp.]|nr:FecR domain-containing protein [Azoarcus sp.]MDD2873262.1 FecR domain-containing protein [Azoarcus sp.]